MRRWVDHIYARVGSNFFARVGFVGLSLFILTAAIAGDVNSIVAVFALVLTGVGVSYAESSGRELRRVREALERMSPRPPPGDED